MGNLSKLFILFIVYSVSACGGLTSDGGFFDGLGANGDQENFSGQGGTDSNGDGDAEDSWRGKHPKAEPAAANTGSIPMPESMVGPSTDIVPSDFIAVQQKDQTSSDNAKTTSADAEEEI